MIAWHASPYAFKRFNTDREGAHFGTREQADNLRKPGKRAAKAYVLNISNPLRIRDMGTWNLDAIACELLNEDVISQADYDAIRAEYNWTDERGYAALKQVLSRLGYDGFVYANEQEGEGDSYVAFYSNQIKPMRMTEYADTVVNSLLESEIPVPWHYSSEVERVRSQHDGWVRIKGRCGHFLHQIRSSDPKIPVVNVDEDCAQCAKEKQPVGKVDWAARLQKMRERRGEA